LDIGDAPSEIFGKNLDSLKSLIIKWIEAEVEEFDIWQIEIETNDVNRNLALNNYILIFCLFRMGASKQSEKLMIKL